MKASKTMIKPDGFFIGFMLFSFILVMIVSYASSPKRTTRFAPSAEETLFLIPITIALGIGFAAVFNALFF